MSIQEEKEMDKAILGSVVLICLILFLGFYAVYGKQMTTRQPLPQGSPREAYRDTQSDIFREELPVYLTDMDLVCDEIEDSGED